jgi:predicted SAM-dependent methyltransferase/tetratricopeptide (TPR) repeat protein
VGIDIATLKSEIAVVANKVMQGDLTEAFNVASHLVAAAPELPEGLNILGVTLMSLERYDEALEAFLLAMNYSDYKDLGYSHNYFYVLLKTKSITDIHMVPPIITASIERLHDVDGFNDRGLAYFLIIQGVTRWPEIYGYWSYFVYYELLYPDDCRSWLKDAALLDPTLAGFSKRYFVAQGLKQFPLNSGLLLLAGLLSLEANSAECSSWFASEALLYQRHMGTANILTDEIFNRTFQQSCELLTSGDNNTPWILMQHQLGLGVESTRCLNGLNSTMFTHNVSQSSSGSPYNISIHIGCHRDYWWQCAKQGWMVVDVIDNFAVSLLGEMHRLSVLPDSSFSALYSSHALEHVSYNRRYPSSTDGASQVCETLVEWNRVLLGGSGILYLAVPDLEVLTAMFQDPARKFAEKMLVMSIIYGGQHDDYDFHKTGFFFEYLNLLLSKSGFCDIERVYGGEGFGLFDDSSALKLYGVPISLNVKAKACPKESSYSTSYLLDACSQVQSLNNLFENGYLMARSDNHE